MTIYEKAVQIKGKMDENQKIVDDVTAAGGIRTERRQSDKVGQDWIEYFVNDISVRLVYAPQANPLGVADNPFQWTPAVACIPNAFYLYEGVRKVWTGAYSETGSAWSHEDFVEF